MSPEAPALATLFTFNTGLYPGSVNSVSRSSAWESAAVSCSVTDDTRGTPPNGGGGVKRIGVNEGVALFVVIPTNKSGAADAATADAANGSVPSPPIDRAGTAGGGLVAFGFGGGGAAGAVATLASSTRRSIDPSVRATVPI
jgi:hypothetical protein